MDLDDTIAAIASAPGGAIRGIVRLSGPNAIACASSLLETTSAVSEQATCTPATMRLPSPLGEVPVSAYLWPTERSCTRQPSAELHLPGSPPILQAALAAACCAGARLARPGEFTLRAFLSGRLDLTQAEAVLGVIDAQNQSELATALGQLAGGMFAGLHALRDQLLDLLAHLEAGLDFVEEDIDFISAAQLQSQLATSAAAVNELAGKLQARGEAGRLPRVVLVGAPNAGKSSLFNALARHSAAIVSEIAGTTRDFVEKRVKLQGRDLLLIDTAGLAEAAGNLIHDEAQKMSRRQLRQSDVTIHCIDISVSPIAGTTDRLALPLGDWPSGDHLQVATKCDLLDWGRLAPAGVIPTSSRTGLGLPELESSIVRLLAQSPTESSVVSTTADRCRESLRLAGDALARASAAAQRSESDELIAAEIRGALAELGHVVGAVYTEDLLDRVFSRFCIGK